MNTAIIALQQNAQALGEHILRKQNELTNTQELLADALYKETCLYNSVLKNNLIAIVNIIHECDLQCASVQNVETLWHHAVYTVADGMYKVKVLAREGCIQSFYEGINNDGVTFNQVKLNKLIDRLTELCEDKKHEN